MNILGNPNPHLLGAPFVRTAMFRAFKAAVGTYVEIPPVTLSGDYDIEVDAVFTGEILALYGRTDNFNVRGRINADGSVECRPVNNSATVTSGPGAVPLNQLSKILFRRQGVGFEIIVNGTSVVSGGTSTDMASFDAIARSSSLYADSIIARFKVASAGDSRLYRNFCRPDRIVPNEMAAVTPQLWQAGDLTLNNAQTWTTLNLGAQTRVKVKKPAAIEVSENGSWVGLGKSELIITTQYLNLRNNSGAPITFTPDVRATTDGFLHNPAEGSDQRYTKKGQAWLGSQLITSMAGPDWVQQGGGVVSASGPTSFTSSNGGAGLKLVGRLKAGQAVQIDAAGLSNCSVWLGLSGATAQKITVDGSHDVVVADGNTDIYVRAEVAGIASYQRLSVRHKIPIAPGAM